MDLDRFLLRTAPVAGFVAWAWIAYRMMNVRIIRLPDIIAFATALAVLYELHHAAKRLTRDERRER
jgi:hypothetical protein